MLTTEVDTEVELIQVQPLNSVSQQQATGTNF